MRHCHCGLEREGPNGEAEDVHRRERMVVFVGPRAHRDCLLPLIAFGGAETIARPPAAAVLAAVQGFDAVQHTEEEHGQCEDVGSLGWHRVHGALTLDQLRRAEDEVGRAHSFERWERAAATLAAAAALGAF